MDRDNAQRQAIERLKQSDAVTVTADEIAPCLKMNPGVLRKRVRDGNYELSKVDYDPEQNGTIRFFRKDFLQKIGEIPPDPEEKTDHQLLDEICAKMDLLISALTALMNQDQRREFIDTWLDEKTASCGNS